MKIDKRFNELMTFAASEATTALSDLIKQPMTVEVIDISVAERGIKKEIAKLYPSKGGAILMTTTLVGMVDGIGTFIVPTDSAYKLCDVLLHRETEHLDELEQSALLEAGNIVIGCFLNALGYVSPLNNILHKKLKLTITEDTKVPDLHYQKNSDEVIVRTTFHMHNKNHKNKVKNVDIDGFCAFFFNRAEVLARI